MADSQLRIQILVSCSGEVIQLVGAGEHLQGLRVVRVHLDRALTELFRELEQPLALIADIDVGCDVAAVGIELLPVMERMMMRITMISH